MIMSNIRSYRAILVVLVLAAIAGLIALPNRAHASGDSVDEIHYSFGETNDSVVFDWHGVETAMYYGPDTNYGSQAVASNSAVTPVDTAGPFMEVKLSNLQPATSYHYKIGVNGLDHVMTTTPTTNFNWVDIGDTGSTLCDPWMAQTQALVALQNPSFVTHGGDISYANECGTGAVHQYYVDQEVWSHSAAFQPVWGNHEYGAPNSSSLPGTIRDSLLNYKGRSYITNAQTVASDKSTQVNNPGCGWETGSKVNTCKGEDWGWFVAGHIMFISYPEPWLTAQVDWGTQAAAVMASAQANPNIDFIVTYGHRPAYTSLIGSESTDLRNSVNALAQTYSPTTANPSGKYILNIGHHIHGEEAFAPINGLVNITNGGGGAGQTSFSVPGDPNSIYKTVHPGILSAIYSAAQHKLSLNLLCGPDYTPKVKEHCTYGSTLYSQSFTRPNTQPSPPVLQTSVTDAASSIQVGQQTTYTLTTTNTQAGSTAATGVAISATVPSNATVINAFGGVVNGNTVTWSQGYLASGQTASQQLTLQVTGDTQLVTSTQVTTSDTSCTNAGSVCTATDTDAVTLPLPAAVTTTISDAVSSIIVGQQTTYNLSTTNTQAGSAPALGASVSAIIPANATVVNAFGGSVSDNTVTWNVGDLAAGQTINEQLTLQANSDVTLVVATQATTTDTSCTNSGSVCSASDTDAITQSPSPVLQTSINNAVSSIQVGQQTTYSLATTNTQTGSTTATGALVTVTIPANATVVNAFGGTISGNTVTWNAGTISANQTVTEQLTLQVTSGTSLIVNSQVTTIDTSCTNVGSNCSAIDTDTVTPLPPPFKQWVLNQGIETDLTGWTGKYGSSSFVTVTRDTTVAHTGGSSIKITGLSGATSLSSGFNDNPRWVVKTVAGTVYTQSAWVDATFVGQRINLRLREWNSTGTTLISDKLVTITALTTGWQQMTQTLTAAGSNNQLSFAVYPIISAGQSLYVDDLSLTTPN